MCPGSLLFLPSWALHGGGKRRESRNQLYSLWQKLWLSVRRHRVQFLFICLFVFFECNGLSKEYSYKFWWKWKREMELFTLYWTKLFEYINIWIFQCIGPVHSLPLLHGKAGVSHLCLYNNTMYSAGRDGVYRQLRIQNNTLEVMDTKKVFMIYIPISYS